MPAHHQPAHPPPLSLATATGLAGVTLAFWWIHTPGVFALDSLITWHEGRIGTFRSNQPPFLGAVWAFFDHFGTGASWLVLLSSAGFVFGTFLVLRRCAGPPAAFAATVAIGLSPPVFATMSTINKETPAVALLLLAAGLVAQRPALRRPLAIAAGAGLCAAMATMFRYQYVIAAAALFAASTLLDIRRAASWRLTAAWLGTLAASYIVSLGLLVGLVNATHDVDWTAAIQRNMRLDMLHMIAAFAAHDPAVPLRDLAQADPSMAGIAPALATDYTPRSNTPLLPHAYVEAFMAVPLPVLRQQVASLAAAYPGIATWHRAEAFFHFLGFHGPCWPIQSRILVPDTGPSPAAVQERRMADTVGLSTLSESLATRHVLTVRWFPARRPIYLPIVFAATCLLTLAWSLVSPGARRRTAAALPLAAAALLYTLSFIPISASCDMRYSALLIVAAHICLAVALIHGASLILARRAR